MRVYKHYGKEVVCQILIDQSFRAVLADKGVQYTDLPIFLNDVLEYVLDGVTKYAVIETGRDPEMYTESVYITSFYPADGDWQKLVNDCKAQQDGSESARMESKAHLICAAAEKMALDQVDFTFGFRNGPDPADFRQALYSMGYDLDTIKVMDHWDVDDDFLQEMSK